MNTSLLFLLLFLLLVLQHSIVTTSFLSSTVRYSSAIRRSTRMKKRGSTSRSLTSSSRRLTASTTIPEDFLMDSTPSTHRAVCYGPFGQPVYEMTRPSILNPKPEHVLVKVQAVGVNPVDAKHVIGDKLPYSWTTIRRWMHNLLVKNTCVGFEFSGIVVKGNSQLRSGTKVYGTMPPLQGTCAEYIQVPLHQVGVMPTKYSFEQAAALPLVGLTAWQALQPYIVSGQSNVLIVGASGGTGHVAIQVSKALGAKDITAVCGSKNVEFCRKLGATHVIDYQKGNVVAQLQAQLQCESDRFDVILDCVTSADPKDAQMDYPSKLRNPSNQLLQQNHLYQRLGGQSPDWIRATLARLQIFPHAWIWKDPRERLFWIQFPQTAGALNELKQLADHRHLTPHVSKVYTELTASNVQQAFDDILTRRVQGKIVVRVQMPEDEEEEEEE